MFVGSGRGVAGDDDAVLFFAGAAAASAGDVVLAALPAAAAAAAEATPTTTARACVLCDLMFGVCAGEVVMVMMTRRIGIVRLAIDGGERTVPAKS